MSLQGWHEDWWGCEAASSEWRGQAGVHGALGARNGEDKDYGPSSWLRLMATTWRSCKCLGRYKNHEQHHSSVSKVIQHLVNELDALPEGVAILLCDFQQ
ncbi:hypothetical protein V7S43_002362 [Phytophthora oleae]|uniref:Uncharacterized protein n=1 Tax=Phytophthora oleae TaxID=2107226 RepID=A0ABD3G1N2_9STRA